MYLTPYCDIDETVSIFSLLACSFIYPCIFVSSLMDKEFESTKEKK